MSLVLALSSVPTAGLAEAAGDFWSPDGIEYVLDKPSPEEGAAIAGPEEQGTADAVYLIASKLRV